MQRSAFLLATTLFAATAAAQLSVVVPNGYATVEGNSNNAFPFTSGTVTTYGVRIQQMYDSSNFTAQGVAGPVLLTGVRLRANATSAPRPSTSPTRRSRCCSRAAATRSCRASRSTCRRRRRRRRSCSVTTPARR